MMKKVTVELFLNPPQIENQLILAQLSNKQIAEGVRLYLQSMRKFHEEGTRIGKCECVDHDEKQG